MPEAVAPETAAPARRHALGLARVNVQNRDVALGVERPHAPHGDDAPRGKLHAHTPRAHNDVVGRHEGIWRGQPRRADALKRGAPLAPIGYDRDDRSGRVRRLRLEAAEPLAARRERAVTHAHRQRRHGEVARAEHAERVAALQLEHAAVPHLHDGPGRDGRYVRSRLGHCVGHRADELHARGFVAQRDRQLDGQHDGFTDLHHAAV